MYNTVDISSDSIATFVVWPVILIFLVGVLIATFILFYHWNRYGAQNPTIFKARIIYITGTLFLVGSSVVFTILAFA